MASINVKDTDSHKYTVNVGLNSVCGSSGRIEPSISVGWVNYTRISSTSFSLNISENTEEGNRDTVVEIWLVPNNDEGASIHCEDYDISISQPGKKGCICEYFTITPKYNNNNTIPSEGLSVGSEIYTIEQNTECSKSGEFSGEVTIGSTTYGLYESNNELLLSDPIPLRDVPGDVNVLMTASYNGSECSSDSTKQNGYTCTCSNFTVNSITVGNPIDSDAGTYKVGTYELTHSCTIDDADLEEDVDWITNPRFDGTDIYVTVTENSDTTTGRTATTYVTGTVGTDTCRKELTIVQVKKPETCPDNCNSITSWNIAPEPFNPEGSNGQFVEIGAYSINSLCAEDKVSFSSDKDDVVVQKAEGKKIKAKYGQSENGRDIKITISWDGVTCSTKTFSQGGTCTCNNIDEYYVISSDEPYAEGEDAIIPQEGMAAGSGIIWYKVKKGTCDKLRASVEAGSITPQISETPELDNGKYKFKLTLAIAAAGAEDKTFSVKLKLGDEVCKTMDFRQAGLGCGCSSLIESKFTFIDHIAASGMQSTDGWVASGEVTDASCANKFSGLLNLAVYNEVTHEYDDVEGEGNKYNLTARTDGEDLWLYLENGKQIPANDTFLFNHYNLYIKYNGSDCGIKEHIPQYGKISCTCDDMEYYIEEKYRNILIPQDGFDNMMIASGDTAVYENGEVVHVCGSLSGATNTGFLHNLRIETGTTGDWPAHKFYYYVSAEEHYAEDDGNIDLYFKPSGSGGEMEQCPDKVIHVKTSDKACSCKTIKKDINHTLKTCEKDNESQPEQFKKISSNFKRDQYFDYDSSNITYYHFQDGVMVSDTPWISDFSLVVKAPGEMPQDWFYGDIFFKVTEDNPLDYPRFAVMEIIGYCNPSYIINETTKEVTFTSKGTCSNNEHGKLIIEQPGCKACTCTYYEYDYFFKEDFSTVAGHSKRNIYFEKNASSGSKKSVDITNYTDCNDFESECIVYAFLSEIPLWTDINDVIIYDGDEIAGKDENNPYVVNDWLKVWFEVERSSYDYGCFLKIVGELLQDSSNQSEPLYYAIGTKTCDENDECTINWCGYGELEMIMQAETCKVCDNEHPISKPSGSENYITITMEACAYDLRVASHANTCGSLKMIPYKDTDGTELSKEEALSYYTHLSGYDTGYTNYLWVYSDGKNTSSEEHLIGYFNVYLVDNRTDNTYQESQCVRKIKVVQEYTDSCGDECDYKTCYYFLDGYPNDSYIEFVGYNEYDPQSPFGHIWNVNYDDVCSENGIDIKVAELVKIPTDFYDCGVRYSAYTEETAYVYPYTKENESTGKIDYYVNCHLNSADECIETNRTLTVALRVIDTAYGQESPCGYQFMTIRIIYNSSMNCPKCQGN